MLQHRRLVKEAHVLLLGAKAHDALHAGAVVPGAVEDDDLTGGGQLLNVALEVPLARLAVSRLGQSFDAASTRVQVLRNALDGGTLAGGVAAFHDNDHAGAGLNDPLLHLDELCLEALELVLIGLLV